MWNNMKKLLLSPYFLRIIIAVITMCIIAITGSIIFNRRTPASIQYDLLNNNQHVSTQDSTYIGNIQMLEYSHAIDTVPYEYFSDEEYAEMIGLLNQFNNTLMTLCKKTEGHLRQNEIDDATKCMTVYLNDYDFCADYQAATNLYRFIKINQKRLWQKNETAFYTLKSKLEETNKHLRFILDRLPKLKNVMPKLELQSSVIQSLETDSTYTDGTWKSKPAPTPVYTPEQTDSIIKAFFGR